MTRTTLLLTALLAATGCVTSSNRAGYDDFEMAKCICTSAGQKLEIFIESTEGSPEVQCTSGLTITDIDNVRFTAIKGRTCLRGSGPIPY